MPALDRGRRISWSAFILSLFVIFSSNPAVSAELCTDRDVPSGTRKPEHKIHFFGHKILELSTNGFHPSESASRVHVPVSVSAAACTSISSVGVYARYFLICKASRGRRKTVCMALTIALEDFTTCSAISTLCRTLRRTTDQASPYKHQATGPYTRLVYHLFNRRVSQGRRQYVLTHQCHMGDRAPQKHIRKNKLSINK